MNDVFESTPVRVVLSIDEETVGDDSLLSGCSYNAMIACEIDISTMVAVGGK